MKFSLSYFKLFIPVILILLVSHVVVGAQTINAKADTGIAFKKALTASTSYENNQPIEKIFRRTYIKHRTYNHNSTVIKDDTSISKRVNAYLKSSKGVSQKLIFQFDKFNYQYNNTIWFKAYSVPLKNEVLYVELIDQEDSILSRSNLKLTSGVAWGDIVLQPDYPGGAYHIRAYTGEMAEQDNFFYRDVHVGEVPPKKLPLLTGSINFYPEGGYLVNGLRSKIAVNAFDVNNNPLKVDGVVTDNSGIEQAYFSTDNYGLGVFALIPSPNNTYKAEIAFSDGQKKSFTIPDALTSGFKLSAITNNKDSLTITIVPGKEMQEKQKDANFEVIGHIDSQVIFTCKGKAADGPASVHIARNKLPPGIIEFALFNSIDNEVSRRSVFNKNTDTLSIALSRSDTDQNIKVTNNNGKPVNGSFSVAISKENEFKNNREEVNLLPGLQLSSADALTDVAVDNLLISKVDRATPPENKKIINNLKYLSLEGYVKTRQNKAAANIKISLFCLDQALLIDTLTNSEGYFKFEDLSIVGKTQVVITARSQSDSKLQIFIADAVYPAVTATADKGYFINTKKTNLVSDKFDKLAIAQKTKDKDVLDKKSQILKEVEVKAKKAPREDMSNNYGASDPYTIAGGALKDLGPSLTHSLAIRLPGAILRNGVLQSIGGGTYPVVLNNHRIPADQIDSFVGPDDVEDIKILEGPIYKILYGISASSSLYAPPTPLGIILITTKKYAGTFTAPPTEYQHILIGDRLFTTTKGPANTMSVNFSGYSVPDEHQTKDLDKAGTVYWDPNLLTDSNGQAHFKMPNAGKGNYRVVVEGIDDEGRLGRAVYRYKVE